MKTALLSLGLSLLTCFGVTHAQSGTHTANSTPTKNIVETAAGTGTFNTLLEAAKAAGFADALAKKGPSAFIRGSFFFDHQVISAF